MIIVAARPSIGKTALTTQWCLHAAAHGHAVGVCSLEMQANEIGIRSFSNRYGLDVGRLFRGEAMALSQVSDEMRERPISNYRILSNFSTYDLPGIVAQIIEWKRKENISYAVVDHMGLVEGVQEERRDLVIGKISRTLKTLANRLSIPIIAVSQLNRSVEKEKRRPMLSDLRDSGSLEQDCDVALFLHANDDGGRDIVDIELGLLKNRDGRKGWITGFQFDGARQRFMQLEMEP